MTLRVLIFGALSQELGSRVLTVNTPERPTLRAVNESLADRFPQRADFFRSARLAVNGSFAEPSRPVSESDEIALIELVSGG